LLRPEWVRRSGTPQGANFRGLSVQFWGTDARSADLRDTEFFSSDLRGADVREASIIAIGSETTLEGARVDGVVWSGERLFDVICPSGLLSDAKLGTCCRQRLTRTIEGSPPIARRQSPHLDRCSALA